MQSKADGLQPATRIRQPRQGVAPCMKLLAFILAALGFALALLVAIVGANAPPQDFAYAGAFFFVVALAVP